MHMQRIRLTYRSTVCDEIQKLLLLNSSYLPMDIL